MTEKQIQEFQFFCDCLEKLALSLDVSNPLMREVAIVMHGFLGVLGCKDINSLMAFVDLAYQCSLKNLSLISDIDLEKILDERAIRSNVKLDS